MSGRGGGESPLPVSMLVTVMILVWVAISVIILVAMSAATKNDEMECILCKRSYVDGEPHGPYICVDNPNELKE